VPLDLAGGAVIVITPGLMNISQSLLATVALVASFGASAGAQATGAASVPYLPFFTLSANTVNGTTGTACDLLNSCNLDGIHSIIGTGTIRSASQSGISARPFNTVGNFFLSVGPGQDLRMNFAGAGLVDLTFRTGSFDTYNTLTVFTTSGSTIFTGSTLAALVGTGPNGNQGFSAFIKFSPTIMGDKVTSLRFQSTRPAMEMSDFSTSANVVPEPSTYVLMATGFAALGVLSRRRKQA